MNHEFKTVAWIKDPAGIARQLPVTVSYEVDGYRPIGLWVYDAMDCDRTLDMTEAEYDVLYAKACSKVAEDMTDAAEMACER